MTSVVSLSDWGAGYGQNYVRLPKGYYVDDLKMSRDILCRSQESSAILR